MEAINDLKRCVKQYRDVDNQLRVLNREIYSKRDARKIIEIEMCDLIKLPQFQSVDKLKIDDDGSYIKIQKPETYSKAWNLSKKDLDILLQNYFNSSSNPNASDCSKFIVEQRKRSLIGKEYEFERIVKEDN